MTTVDEARDWLREHADDGATCPVCTQYAKVYRRKLTAHTAAVLVAMIRQAGHDWVHLPSLSETEKGGDAIKARYWGLIEERRGQRADGSTRAGWWRLTAKGERFVRGEIRIPKYARIYNGRCLGLDASEFVTIRDCLGTRFNYDELMAGV